MGSDLRACDQCQLLKWRQEAAKQSQAPRCHPLHSFTFQLRTRAVCKDSCWSEVCIRALKEEQIRGEGECGQVMLFGLPGIVPGPTATVSFSGLL